MSDLSLTDLLVLDSNRLIRWFGGKSGVTEKTYNKENDSHAVDQLQISL